VAAAEQSMRSRPASSPKDDVCEFGRRGGGKRGQDRPLSHRAAGRVVLRARLSWPYAARHDADVQGDAVQERLRSVRPEVYRLPFPYCYRCERAQPDARCCRAERTPSRRSSART
jgi:hypothetical protein